MELIDIGNESINRMISIQLIDSVGRNTFGVISLHESLSIDLNHYWSNLNFKTCNRLA